MGRGERCLDKEANGDGGGQQAQDHLKEENLESRGFPHLLWPRPSAGTET